MIGMKLVSYCDGTEQEGKRVSRSEEEKPWGEESFGGVSLEEAWCSGAEGLGARLWRMKIHSSCRKGEDRCSKMWPQ